MGDKKPDNYVDNPGIMPYGTDLGAPSIRPENIENWKNSKIIKVNKEFSNRYEFLKKQYDDLIEEFKWNDMIYRSNLILNLLLVKLIIYTMDKTVKNFYL